MQLVARLVSTEPSGGWPSIVRGLLSAVEGPRRLLRIGSMHIAMFAPCREHSPLRGSSGMIQTATSCAA